MYCTVLVIIPTTARDIDAPNLSIVHTNVDCNLKFTRYSHVCANNTAISKSRPKREMEYMEVQLRKNHIIQRPRYFCPRGKTSWVVYKAITSTRICAHLDVTKTYQSYNKFCEQAIKLGTFINLELESTMMIWSKHIGIPLLYNFQFDPYMNLLRQMVTETPYNIRITGPKKYTWKCSEGLFECLDGTCILDIRVCDGKPDCIDKSDELTCSTVCKDGDVEKTVSNIVNCIAVSMNQTFIFRIALFS